MPKFSLWLVGLVLVLAACQGTAEPVENGVLRGHVGFLPTWLEVGASGTFEPMPADFYAQRKILVIGEGEGNSFLVSLGDTGDYRIELAPGSYYVDIRGTRMDLGIGLPAPVEIVAGKEVVLDIKIDTGVR